MARPKGIPFNEETAGSNYAEFAITRKPDKAIKTKRLLFILLYAAFAFAYIFMFTVVVMIPYLLGILPLFVAILWFFTWKLTKIEYLYIAYQGMFRVYCYNGYNRAKEIFSARLSENDGVYPANDEDYAPYAKTCEVKLDYSVGEGTEDRYFAIFDVKGKKTAVYFTAATKLLAAMRYYGGDRVILTYVSR
ncbi:MAG: hypothetical protein IJV98_02155 [Clostridia bacterium]|nr:hypothetical protein [Clostridia bacterium]